MIWTKQHIKDFFKAQGHDPDEVLTRLAARDSIKHDLEAWAILREWYDRHPRMSKDIISEVLDLPPATAPGVGVRQAIPIVMNTFISLSGGVESTTMCILYGAGAKGIWADTGAEHDEMYERINLLEDAIARIHPGFEVIRVKGKTSAYGNVVDTLLGYIKAAKLLPSSGQRFCTDRFKIAPIERYLKTQGPCELLIGFNADEQPGEARKGNHMKLKNVTYRYPLYEDGHTRDDCEDILRQHGLHPNFPIYMRRGGCFMCFYKSEAEYKAMYFLDNDTFMRAWSLEKEVQDKRKKYYSLLSGRPLAILAAECEREKATWGMDAVLKMYESQPKGKTCGAFCNR